MPRRPYAHRKPVTPDPLYNSVLVTKFINAIMIQGKKSVAEKILYGALDIIREKIKEEDTMEVFKKSIENAMPQLEVKSRRIGGSNYQVPIEIRPKRKESLAFKWIKTYSREKNGRTMREKLANELIDCYNNTGSTIKKKEDTHKMAAANKAFAHYRF